MIWNDPKKLPDGSREPRTGQPQSSDEYAKWCEHFPDPGAASTHVVVYRWENSPNPNAPRRLVIEYVPKAEAKAEGSKAPVEVPANEARRKELAALERADLVLAYGAAGLGDLKSNISSTKAVAAILEAEAKLVSA